MSVTAIVTSEELYAQRPERCIENSALLEIGPARAISKAIKELVSAGTRAGKCRAVQRFVAAARRAVTKKPRVFTSEGRYRGKGDAWDNLKKALRGTYNESVWDHLAGTVSAPFEAGEHGQIAIKVIDDRGNELMVVKDFKNAR